jgi:CheY-like chemotaxis protein
LGSISKGGSPKKQPVSIIPLIQETVEFALSGSNVSYHLNKPENPWICNIDKNQISQVISNICINAQQAMPKGGALEISVKNINFKEKAHPFLAQGDYVKITLKDYGIGISKKLLSSIFDPFYTTKLKGQGLGLAIAYSITTSHGGTIDVESVIDEGSSFHVYLPAMPDKLYLQTDTDMVSKHRGSGTILIMDDEEIIRESMGKMLEYIGYSVIYTKDGNEALEIFKNEKKANRIIKGLFLDLTIPGGLGGKDIITDLRSLNKELPIFAISGYSDDPIMKDPNVYGFTASLCKPFRRNEVMQILEKHMD